ncbi:hypothetical protein, partial [Acinetobacter baumannii]|uniref:hypothetical protein n=1 Tax=Acinetobacter baumannii TaxID=470 RepID=UPI001C086EE3
FKEAGFPVSGVIRDVAGLLERLDQVGRRVTVVFDYQNPHVGHGREVSRQSPDAECAAGWFRLQA